MQGESLPEKNHQNTAQSGGHLAWRMRPRRMASGPASSCHPSSRAPAHPPRNHHLQSPRQRPSVRAWPARRHRRLKCFWISPRHTAAARRRRVVQQFSDMGSIVMRERSRTAWESGGRQLPMSYNRRVYGCDAEGSSAYMATEKRSQHATMYHTDISPSNVHAAFQDGRYRRGLLSWPFACPSWPAKWARA